MADDDKTVGSGGRKDCDPVARRSGNYRDLRVWHDAVDLAVRAYNATDSFPTHERFGLGRQIRDAATSIPSNIAEGHRRGGRAAYLAFLRIAAGSHGELETHIEIACRVGLLTNEVGTALLVHAERVGRQLTRLMQVLRGV